NYPTNEVSKNINKRINEVPVTSEERLEVTFIDVGQADSILLENEGHYMLVDAGNNEDGPKLVNYLKNQNIHQFDYVIGTHPHEDHIGGLDNIIEGFDINTFYMPDVITTTKTFEDVLDALGEKNMTLSIPKTNATFKLGDATVKVLYVGTEDESDLNDTSIVLKVTYQNVSFLLTGDASTKVEEKLNPADLESTVLKVGHHGSSTATNEKFLNTVNPKYAIISVGENNQYEHPHTTVLNTLAAHNITTYRTDQDGTIKVITDGTNIEINTSKTDTNG
ncbi:MAG: ComEC/Rec2 family competence protein, partial [Candidatus Faecimonas sp.]|nr:ComEC/Rec2 family competence protein [Candidatus Faecimonas sp.]